MFTIRCSQYIAMTGILPPSSSKVAQGERRPVQLRNIPHAGPLPATSLNHYYWPTFPRASISGIGIANGLLQDSYIVPSAPFIADCVKRIDKAAPHGALPSESSWVKALQKPNGLRAQRRATPSLPPAERPARDACRATVLKPRPTERCHMRRFLISLLAVFLFASPPCAAHTQTIMTVAGNGSSCTTGDGGPATSAQLQHPAGIAADGALSSRALSCGWVRKILTWDCKNEILFL
jgi:hypothetical protein